MDFSIGCWSGTRLRRPIEVGCAFTEEQWKYRGEEPAREDEGFRAVEFPVPIRDAATFKTRPTEILQPVFAVNYRKRLQEANSGRHGWWKFPGKGSG